MTFLVTPHNPARNRGGRKDMTVAEHCSYLTMQLRTMREQTGLSQLDIGRSIRTPAQLVSEWERGEVTPNLSRFIAWAAELGFTVQLKRLR